LFLFCFRRLGKLIAMVNRRRFLDPGTAEAALKAAGECRARCVQVLTQAPIGEPAYLAARGILEAVDNLAEVLTGDRRHFHTKPHVGNF
jgi:hypothetical protein